MPLRLAASVDVGAGVGGMGQHAVHGRIGRRHPGDLGDLARDVQRPLHRPGHALVFQPQPDRAGRAEHLELGEHRSDQGLHLLVGMVQDLPVSLAVDQADRQATAQLAAGGLAADPAVQPGPQHLQLSLAHDPFHAQEQAVIK